MTRITKTVGWTLLAALVLSIALITIVLSSVGAWDPTLIEFDGGPLTLAQFHAGHWLLTAGGALLALIVALLVVLVIVPVAVLVPLLVVALSLVGVLVVVAGAAALVFSPLILAAGVVWLIWRVARSRRNRAPGAGATIAG
jgi:hypothetical protein